MTTSPQTLLVLGATGFIGRNLVEHYARDPRFRVRAVAHRRPRFEVPGVEWLQCDLRDAVAVGHLFTGVDIVLQAAATTSGSKDIVQAPSLHVTDNAVMNSLIFRACHEQKVQHVVFFSCSVMYPVNLPSVAEDAVTMESIHPRYFGVGWTKVYLEKMAEFYARLGTTRFTVVRHSNIYGPHDKFDLERSHVFGATMTKIASALKRGETELTVWGEGKELRDLLHVEDLLSFIDLSLQRQQEPFFLCNVGSGEGTSINQLVSSMQEAMGTKLQVRHDLSKPSIPVDIVLDTKRAHALGWQPKIQLAAGIRRTWAWYQENVS